MKPASTPHSAAAATPLLRACALALCVLAVAGCSTVKGWFDGKDEDATEPAKLTEFSPTVTVSELWSADVGEGEDRLGIRQHPVIVDGRVYAAAVDGGVHALDLQTGKRIWHYPSELRLSGGPGAGDGLVVVGSLDGDVIALDASTGAERWQAKVGNEIIAEPVVGLGMVFVRSNDGRLTAFDAATGERRWFWNHDVPSLSVRGNDAPVLGPGYVFVGSDDGTVSALAAADGRPLWEQAVGQQEGRTELDRMADVDGTPVLDGTTIIATSFDGRTMAIDAPSGQPMWVSNHGGPGRAAVAPSVLAVSSADGNVYGLEKRGGSALWTQPGLVRRNLSAPAVHGGYAVVGDYDGYLHWLDLATGAFAARARAGGDAIRAVPVVSGDILIAQDVDGGLSAFRIAQ
ncbi:outer membrane protein assembly factor BamB [Novilysobacter arseniciresistens]|uniref:outer membrane protein assembly factor BamB n=1 Tax=Novilysobacter arseniciresistens TaxID=1385522 RepID=UPI0009DE4512|nr:outer membrane protein assembly factor BamB [Lysobacter arseniciresistens]